MKKAFNFFLGGVVLFYTAYVSLFLYNWFVLTIFPNLPQLVFEQMVGLLLIKELWFYNLSHFDIHFCIENSSDEMNDLESLNYLVQFISITAIWIISYLIHFTSTL